VDVIGDSFDAVAPGRYLRVAGRGRVEELGRLCFCPCDGLSHAFGRQLAVYNPGIRRAYRWRLSGRGYLCC
jgi:hypothetical protein